MYTIYIYISIQINIVKIFLGRATVASKKSKALTLFYLYSTLFGINLERDS